jgi:hypothetical protein
MSKWTEFRDDIVKALHVDEVTEELKQKVSQAIIDEVFPPIEDAVATFSAKVREQSVSEAGWCKVRDGIVLPLILNAIVYVCKTVLTKSLSERV